MVTVIIIAQNQFKVPKSCFSNISFPAVCNIAVKGLQSFKDQSARQIKLSPKRINCWNESSDWRSLVHQAWGSSRAEIQIW